MALQATTWQHYSVTPKILRLNKITKLVHIFPDYIKRKNSLGSRVRGARARLVSLMSPYVKLELVRLWIESSLNELIASRALSCLRATLFICSPRPWGNEPQTLRSTSKVWASAQSTGQPRNLFYVVTWYEFISSPVFAPTSNRLSANEWVRNLL